MRWQAPEFTDIEMNAEIGAYQRDPTPAADAQAVEAAPPATAAAQPEPEVVSSRG